MIYMIMEVLVSPVYFQGVASCKKFQGKNLKKQFLETS